MASSMFTVSIFADMCGSGLQGFVVEAPEAPAGSRGPPDSEGAMRCFVGALKRVELCVCNRWGISIIRRPGSACTVFFFFLCRIQNLSQNPKSKIPKLQNPQNPKSPKFGALGASHEDLLHNGPKSKIQNPQNRQKNLDFGFWIGGFWILDFGPKIQNPKSPRSKIQNPQNPKSEIPKIQNPKSPKSPKSSAKIQNLGRWGPHKKICYITIQNPKSQIPKIQNLGMLDFGFWIRGILDLGFWGFGILDLGDFGFWIWGILGFGFGGFGILDLGDFGFWILGILDLGFCWFWCFWGGPGDVPLGNLVTVLGGQRLESPLVRLSGTVQNQLYLI